MKRAGCFCVHLGWCLYCSWCWTLRFVDWVLYLGLVPGLSRLDLLESEVWFQVTGSRSFKSQRSLDPHRGVLLPPSLTVVWLCEYYIYYKMAVWQYYKITSHFTHETVWEYYTRLCENIIKLLHTFHTRQKQTKRNIINHLWIQGGLVANNQRKSQSNFEYRRQTLCLEVFFGPVLSSCLV